MIAIDIESSGVDYNKNSIISIGAIDFDDPSRSFYGECRVWEGSHVSRDAIEFLQMSEVDFRDLKKQSEGELVEKFMRWIEPISERTLLGQNVSFDRDFLKAACVRIHHDWSLAHRTIDTHTLCYMHIVKRGMKPPIDSEMKRSSLNLDAILKYCGIPDEPIPHNALTGAKSHAEVAYRLLYDKKFLSDFDQFDIPWLKA